MEQREIVVIGGGPAGLSAALQAAHSGARVTIIEGEKRLGGQLIKQTHMFFGSHKQHAGTRGIDIATLLENELRALPNVEIILGATVLGYYYEDGALTIEDHEAFRLMIPKRLIVASGASEKFLAFPNNDLPGVYGAGAVQTLMNVYGVKPAQRVLMIGAGNIGLIVSYQLLQAGVEVAAVLEAAPQISGYLVHASKILRLGVPILTRHSIKEALGKHTVEGAIIHRLDDRWQPVPHSEQQITCDTICLAVGLSPLCDLLWQAGCAMQYIAELGGYVALRDEGMQTSVPGIYVAGDAAGVEEASAAMVEGSLAGLSAALSLGYNSPADEELTAELRQQLDDLRAGPGGAKIRSGLEKLHPTADNPKEVT
ncbi:MAG: FAD-dependent oxidoreductase [Symbiobacteriaceae bacterium]|nr:FAD-dependent oxidoreductase [Symbiobacteriaceae bacterium]